MVGQHQGLCRRASDHIVLRRTRKLVGARNDAGGILCAGTDARAGARTGALAVCRPFRPPWLRGRDTARCPWKRAYRTGRCAAGPPARHHSRTRTAGAAVRRCRPRQQRLGPAVGGGTRSDGAAASPGCEPAAGQRAGAAAVGRGSRGGRRRLWRRLRGQGAPGGAEGGSTPSPAAARLLPVAEGGGGGAAPPLSLLVGCEALRWRRHRCAREPRVRAGGDQGGGQREA